jgi:tRNA-dihydrouridine synthase 2
MGAALLRDPNKLCSILDALVQNITPEFKIGISVKIRLLEKPEDTESLVRRLVATGITGLTVHCRTTPMRSREPAIRGQLRMVAGVCREAGVACLINGDVDSREHALSLVDEFDADGAMIARAAEENPTCFRAQADGGALPWDQMVKDYVSLALEVDNRFGNTKYLLGRMIPGSQKVYSKMQQSRNYTALCEILGHDKLLELARNTDHKRGLDQLLTGKTAPMNPADGEKQPKRRKSEVEKIDLDAEATMPSHSNGQIALSA